MIAALIFDVDGTLAETEEYHRRAFNQAFAQAGLDWYWDEATYRTLLVTTGGKERMLSFAGERFPEMLGGLRSRVMKLHQLKTRIYTRAVAGGNVPLRPGMMELIGEARAAGIICAIATTTSLENIAALLSATLGPSWNQTFPVIVAGDMVAQKKPAPDVYQLALSRLGLGPEHCLAIEDSRNGVLAARAAGLKVVGVRSAYTIGDDLAGAIRVFANPGEITLSALQALV